MFRRGIELRHILWALAGWFVFALGLGAGGMQPDTPFMDQYSLFFGYFMKLLLLAWLISSIWRRFHPPSHPVS